MSKNLSKESIKTLNGDAPSKPSSRNYYSCYFVERYNNLDKVSTNKAMLAPRKTLHSTPLLVFSGALERLKVQPNDVLYDIGCGDGRCVIEAAQKYGIKAVGIEIDGERVLQARQKAKDAGVDHLVTIYKGNALDFDFSEATIIFLFLIERGLK
jgi:cyclopropane fatty-acyl-phospholipid synthase-like methyltransferase